MTRFSLFFYSFLLAAQVSPVLTRSANNQRTGAYLQEKILTPANIHNLHRLYSVNIPNDQRGMETQPLVLPNVLTKADGKIHDLLILATMANDVIACDLHTGVQLWTANLGKPVKGSNKIDFWSINDNWGIVGTPVIDGETQFLYAVAWSSPDGTPDKAAHFLHAVDLKTGKEPKPALPLAGVSYDPGNGLPIVHFNSTMRKQRTALTLATVSGHKTLFFGCGTVQEVAQGASGLILAADVDTWRFAASWASTVRFYGAGIWNAGQGIAADAIGDLYPITGNGSFDAVSEFSECFLHLRYVPPASDTAQGQIKVMDWWSAYSDAGRVGQDPTKIVITGIPLWRKVKLAGVNAATKDGALPVNHGHSMKMPANAGTGNAAYEDQDLGSGGAVLVPQYNLVGGAGKDGIWYSVRMGNMGKTKPADFANPALNYAKLLSPPVWFTFAAFKHNASGQVIGYENAAPQNETDLNFNYGNQTHHMHSTPVVFQSANHGLMMFCWGENGNLRAWTLQPNGSLTFLGNSQELASPQAPANPGGMPGGMLALSANGTQNALLYAIVPMGDANRELTGGTLYIYDATNLDKYPDGSGWLKLLWHSTVPFRHPKFNVPVISGGYVILPTFDHRVDVMGVN